MPLLLAGGSGSISTLDSIFMHSTHSLAIPNLVLVKMVEKIKSFARKNVKLSTYHIILSVEHCALSIVFNALWSFYSQVCCKAEFACQLRLSRKLKWFLVCIILCIWICICNCICICWRLHCCGGRRIAADFGCLRNSWCSTKQLHTRREIQKQYKTNTYKVRNTEAKQQKYTPRKSLQYNFTQNEKHYRGQLKK